MGWWGDWCAGKGWVGGGGGVVFGGGVGGELGGGFMRVRVVVF